jgi:hypothetical protein
MSADIRKPPFWNRMSFTAKAGYLCASKQARDYSEACSMLAKQPRRPLPKRTPKEIAGYWWNNS